MSGRLNLAGSETMWPESETKKKDDELVAEYHEKTKRENDQNKNPAAVNPRSK